MSTVAAIAISAVEAQPAMATRGPRRKARMTDLFVASSIMATMIGTATKPLMTAAQNSILMVLT